MISSPPLTAAAWLRIDAIRRGFAEAKPRCVLEVGAGEGGMAWRLGQQYDYHGLEPDAESFARLVSRLEAVDSAEASCETAAEFADEPRYDLVCAFEVLEHIENDTGELRRWGALLRSGGYILLSVPAHRDRFGPSDTFVGHERRYSRADLEKALVDAGFRPLWIEAWGAGLGHLLEWGRNWIAESMESGSVDMGASRSGRWLQPHTRAAGVLTWMLAAPFRVIQHPLRNGQCGIGWVTLGRKD